MSRAALVAAAIVVGVVVTTATATSCAAADLVLPRDGWVSWQVPAVADTPNWCCFRNWEHSSVREEQVCELDGHNFGFSNRERGDTTREIRVYARFAEGKLDRLRTLASTCQVAANTPIRSLDSIAVDTSAKWLAAQITPRSKLSGDAMAALSAHQSTLARDALASVARSDAEVKNRKDAMFWLTQVRGAEGFDLVSPYLFDDGDAHIREHAAFAISQSRAKPAAPLLIRAGREDSAREVRSKAWFWLAQTGAPETESAIRSAMTKEEDARVREQAIFALSQLRGERATVALAAIIEDKSLPREDRKRAVFWMGQQKSDYAVQYLDKILATKTGS